MIPTFARVVLVGLLLAAGPAVPAAGQTLSEALRAAQGRDPAVAGARAQADAAVQRIGVLEAGRSTTLGLSGTANTQYAEINGGSGRQIEGGTAALNLVVPVYRPQVGVAVEQATVASRAVAVTVSAAEQDLMLRVGLAYLDVLSEIETLRAIAGQKAAVAGQLAAARRSFEVGTGTIVDPNEAQSRFDAIVAREIVATSDLAVRRAALAQLIGRGVEQVRRMPPEAELPPLRPAVLDDWLELADAGNPAIRRARLDQEVAQREIDRRSLGQRPGVDAVGTLSREVNPSPLLGGLRSNAALLGLQFSWPLWDGGAVRAGVREALALAGKSAADLEAAQRAAELEVRRLFRKLGSGLAVVAALRAAERSAEVTLRSMQRALEVGVRVTTDVLDAQQQLFTARRDLARARYDFLADLLRLRAAAGQLRDEDIDAISRLLSEPVDPSGRR
jgi:outer membrane protein